MGLFCGFLLGIFGTYIMDATNKFLSAKGWIGTVNPLLLGKLAHGWTKGTFIHPSVSAIPEVSHAKIKGMITHYLIGAVLGIIFVESISIFHITSGLFFYAILYGIATSIFAWFVLFPSIGFGFFGFKAPKHLPMFRTSFINHTNFGVGMGVGLFVLKHFGLFD